MFKAANPYLITVMISYGCSGLENFNLGQTMGEWTLVGVHPYENWAPWCGKRPKNGAKLWGGRFVEKKMMNQS